MNLNLISPIASSGFRLIETYSAISCALASKVVLFATAFFSVFTATFLALVAHRMIYPPEPIPQFPTAAEIALELPRPSPPAASNSSVVTDPQEEKIDPMLMEDALWMVNILGENGNFVSWNGFGKALSLKSKEPELRKKGQALENIPPFAFLKAILASPLSFENFKKLLNANDLVLSPFMGGQKGKETYPATKGLNARLLEETTQFLREDPKNLLLRLNQLADLKLRDQKETQNLFFYGCSCRNFVPFLKYLTGSESAKCFASSKEQNEFIQKLTTCKNSIQFWLPSFEL